MILARLGGAHPQPAYSFGIMVLLLSTHVTLAQHTYGCACTHAAFPCPPHSQTPPPHMVPSSLAPPHIHTVIHIRYTYTI